MTKNIYRIAIKPLKFIKQPESWGISCHNCFYTSSPRTSVTKQFRIMNKLLSESRKKRKNWFDAKETIMPSKKSLQENIKGNKRVVVLNKLFMKYITDIMATGEYSTQIAGKGIDVTRVKVTNDFNIVNVYWIAKNYEDIDEIEKILRRTAGALQNELSSLRVVGNVPNINFVRDKSHTAHIHLEHLLKTADYGEDFEPTATSDLVKAEFSMENLQIHEQKAKITKLEGNKLPAEDEQEPLPPMRQDVFGLDHKEISDSIIHLSKKSKAPHRQEERRDQKNVYSEETMTLIQTINKNSKVIEFDKEKFTQFLKAQEISKQKIIMTKMREDNRIEKEDSYEYEDSLGQDEEQDYIEDDTEKDRK